jgi:hypothetical protein
MSTDKIRCKAVPSDAELKDFDVFGDLNVRFVWNETDGKIHIELLSDIRFVLKKYNYEILIKKGFTCDGGSINQLFWTTTSSPYSTRLLLAFLLHDALYASEHFTRSECDWIFLELMAELGASWIVRNRIWLAVKSFGWTVWNAHEEKTVKEARAHVKKIPVQLGVLGAAA